MYLDIDDIGDIDDIDDIDDTNCINDITNNDLPYTVSLQRTLKQEVLY